MYIPNEQETRVFFGKQGLHMPPIKRSPGAESIRVFGAPEDVAPVLTFSSLRELWEELARSALYVRQEAAFIDAVADQWLHGSKHKRLSIERWVEKEDETTLNRLFRAQAKSWPATRHHPLRMPRGWRAQYLRDCESQNDVGDNTGSSLFERIRLRLNQPNMRSS
ncbi:MAG: hypothetical protein J0H86_24000 [Xanthomonadaceae bacterium]|nr:hypothetical protein [Xanthomonadaceae bacterium]